MSTLVQNVCKLSQNIFANLRSRSSERTLDEKTNNLIRLFSNVTLEDLYLNVEELYQGNLCGRFKYYCLAPVSYTSIFENNTFSLTVFGLRKKSSCLPLHDHPGMHGFIKCLYGSLSIKSYNILPNYIEVPTEILKRISPNEHKNIVPANFLGEETVSSDSSVVCSLTPSERNIHEIKPADNQMAIMADIISPPYTSQTEHYFYRIIDSIYDSNLKLTVTWLLKSQDTNEYFCDNVPYRGPSIKI